MTNQTSAEYPQIPMVGMSYHTLGHGTQTASDYPERYIPADTLPMADFEKQFIPRQVDAIEVGARHRQMWDRVSASQETSDKNTEELMTYFPPQLGIEVGSNTFLLSTPFASEGDRKHAIGYTEVEDGTIAPRLFYKSNSDGFWRVAPYYDSDQGFYSKGETMEFGYVRETRLNDDLESLLQRTEAQTTELDNGQVSWVLEHFDVKKLGRAYTYEDEAFEIKIIGLNDFFKFAPGYGFKTEDGQPARDVMRDMHAEPDRLPDFSLEPVHTRKLEHALLGAVQIDSYRSLDGLLVWNMAHTPDGKVWVQGITSSTNNQTTSYGTDWEVLSGGVLDSKPIEYETQVVGLEEGVDYCPTGHNGYVELTVLDNLEPIRNFREVRNIQRRPAERAEK